MLRLWRNILHKVSRHLRRHGYFQSRVCGRDWRRVCHRHRFQLSAASRRHPRQTTGVHSHHSSGQHPRARRSFPGKRHQPGALVSTAAQRFLQDAAVKSADLMHRDVILHNLESYDASHLKGRARIKDWEAARHKCHEIKREAIDHLDRYPLQFEEKVIARGGHVFWAANSEEACSYIKNLATQRGVRTVVKSKSMVTEEIHLSPVLEKAGIKVWETDLGEFIVQLRNEPPYHIVTPAMHLNRTDIAELFREKLGGVESNDPQELVAAARRVLRKEFFAAEMGISGV